MAKLGNGGDFKWEQTKWGAISHQGGREAEKPFYRVRSRERKKKKMRGEAPWVPYRAAVFADVSFLRLSFLLHLGYKRHPVTL